MVSSEIISMKEELTILERILSLFKRYGFRSVTMGDIAGELGVSKKTLYKEFRDKDDLINQVIDFDRNQSRRNLKEVYQSAPNALEELFMVNRFVHSLRSSYSPTFYYDLRRYFPEIYKRWMGDKRQNMYDLITGNLRKGKREGVYREEINEHTIGKLYMARIEMLESNDIIEEQESHSLEFMQEVFSYHLHGICNKNGLKILSGFEKTDQNHQVRQT
jgi:AcrR family transcriptional regulator